MRKPQEGEVIGETTLINLSKVASSLPATPYTDTAAISDGGIDRQAAAEAETLRRRYRDERQWLMHWTTQSTERRRTAIEIAQQPLGITYNTIDDNTATKRRTIRHHVRQLHSQGYIIKYSNPVNVRIPTEESLFLFIDVLQPPR